MHGPLSLSDDNHFFQPTFQYLLAIYSEELLLKKELYLQLNISQFARSNPHSYFYTRLKIFN